MTELMTSCKESLQSAVTLYRQGKEGQAGEKLVRFIDALMKLLATFPPERTNRLTPYLNEIISAQSRKDHLRVADLLEYEISRLL